MYLFSFEGWNLRKKGRAGELMFQVISTETEVFVFDMEYFGVTSQYLQMDLYGVLGELV